ncbi:MAG: carbohydrate binding family 9 domain-containing protein [bacterium]|nr:carbohydrate binding family 9 domain-containing protein [bacterium]
MNRYIVIVMTVFLLGWLPGQLEADGREPVEIPLLDTAPLMDGKLDDPVWQSAARFEGFVTFSPDYGNSPSQKTLVYAYSDRENFYFAARCYQAGEARIKATVTRRDNMFSDDWVGFCIDTFNNHQSAYGFLVNPLGIQGDGILDATGDLDDSHDMVWYSKGTIDESGYSVEVRVPFKSIRFPVGKHVKMGLWLVRKIVFTSEDLSYPEIYPDNGGTLAQSQPVWVKDMKYKRVVELLPSISYNRGQFRENGQWTPADSQKDFGFTGKVGITPGLVLDATYNPDFSQVESDAGRVDVNLRYDLFFPEKRPFFLEGIEAFRFAGTTPESPLQAIVHTRRIIDPLLGLKLTGKIGGKNSVAGIFAIDEPYADNSASHTPNATFGILRFRHAMKNDNYIGGFYTGRDESDGYNRIAGIDGRFRLSQSATAEYHLLGSLSKDTGDEKPETGHVLGLRYKLENRKLGLEIGLQDIAHDFRIDSGFLTRKGISRLFVYGIHHFFPKSKFFQRIDPYYWSFHIRDKAGGLWETFNLFVFRVHMPRNSMFRFDVIVGREVFAGQSFDTSGLGIQSNSQLTRQLGFYLIYRHRSGIFYDPGNPFPGRTNLFRITLEYQPVEKFTNLLNVTYTDFYRESDSMKEYDFTIIRNHTTYQVNKYLFFRGIVEYNFFRDQLQLDALASFTYIPGTVVHVGWGSLLDKTRWDNDLGQYVPAPRLRELQRGFFFKVSYLWRF